MCWHHGRLIDQDDGRFTPDVLYRYKERAEHLAEQLMYHPETAIRESSLVPVERSLAVLPEGDAPTSEARLPSQWREAVYNLLSDGAVFGDWTEQVGHDIFQLVIELSLNSVQHGTATGLHLSTARNVVELRLEGEHYRFEDLEKEAMPNNGTAVASRFLQDHRHFLSVHSQDLGRGVCIRISTRPNASPSDPCSIEASRHTLTETALQALSSCTVVNVHTPRFWVLSDQHFLLRAVRTGLEQGSAVVVHSTREQHKFVSALVSGRFAAEMDSISFNDTHRPEE